MSPLESMNDPFGITLSLLIYCTPKEEITSSPDLTMAFLIVEHRTWSDVSGVSFGAFVSDFSSSEEILTVTQQEEGVSKQKAERSWH